MENQDFIDAQIFITELAKGTNQYDFKFEYIDSYYKDLMYKDITVNQKNGFNVGLIGDLRINNLMSSNINDLNFKYPHRPFLGNL